MKPRTAVIVGLSAIVLIVILLLVGPGVEKSQPEQVLWSRDFSIVEYIPASKERRITFRAKREASLTKDRFIVEVPGKYAPRRGSYNTKNIFTDFGKPRNAGRYPRGNADLAEYGITAESAEVILYQKEGGSPLRIRIGKKNQGGNSFAVIESDEFKDELVLIPSFLFDRFERPFKEFRDVRFVNYGTDQFTESLSLKVQTAQGEKTFRMMQSKYKKDGIEMPRWQTDSGDEIPLSLANSLENAVRDLQIEEFRDKEGLPDAESLWQKAGRDSVTAELSVKGQGTFTIRLRSSAPAQSGAQALILLQTSVDVGTDFAKASAETDILDRLRQVEEGLRAKAEAAKRQPVPPQERAP
jgi:hypothetical protein